MLFTLNIQATQSILQTMTLPTAPPRRSWIAGRPPQPHPPQPQPLPQPQLSYLASQPDPQMNIPQQTLQVLRSDATTQTDTQSEVFQRLDKLQTTQNKVLDLLTNRAEQDQAALKELFQQLQGGVQAAIYDQVQKNVELEAHLKEVKSELQDLRFRTQQLHREMRVKRGRDDSPCSLDTCDDN